MVAQTGDAPHEAHPSSDWTSQFDHDNFDPHKQGGLRRLVVSIARLADLQGRIWLTEAKLTVLKIALYTALFGAATLIGILGIIFLFIGLFHVLTDLLHIPTVYAFLIFGTTQILLAVIIALIANKKLAKKIPAETRAAL